MPCAPPAPATGESCAQGPVIGNRGSGLSHHEGEGRSLRRSVCQLDGAGFLDMASSLGRAVNLIDAYVFQPGRWGTLEAGGMGSPHSPTLGSPSAERQHLLLQSVQCRLLGAAAGLHRSRGRASPAHTVMRHLRPSNPSGPSPTVPSRRASRPSRWPSKMLPRALNSPEHSFTCRDRPAACTCTPCCPSSTRRVGARSEAQLPASGRPPGMHADSAMQK